MIPYTNSPFSATRVDDPHSPYPLIWLPRVYGTTFGLIGLAGAS